MTDRRLVTAILTLTLMGMALVWGCVPATETFGASAPRSSQWPKVRAAYLVEHPRCEACGGRGGLQVHHVIPFKAGGDADEDEDGITNELDPDNLITLCTGDTMNCHLWLGHAGNFKTYNPCVREDAARFRDMIACRKANE